MTYVVFANGTNKLKFPPLRWNNDRQSEDDFVLGPKSALKSIPFLPQWTPNHVLLLTSLLRQAERIEREKKKITKQTPREDFHKLNELSFWPPLLRKASKASPLRNTNNSQFIKLIFRQLENAFVLISISRNWQLSGPARNLRWKNGISFASSGWFDIYGGGGKAFIVMCPCQSWRCCWLFRFIRGVKQCVSIDCYHFFFVFTVGY